METDLLTLGEVRWGMPSVCHYSTRIGETVYLVIHLCCPANNTPTITLLWPRQHVDARTIALQNAEGQKWTALLLHLVEARHRA